MELFWELLSESFHPNRYNKTKGPGQTCICLIYIHWTPYDWQTMCKCVSGLAGGIARLSKYSLPLKICLSFVQDCVVIWLLCADNATAVNPRPTLTPQQATELTQQLYGVTVTEISTLPSYMDQNLIVVDAEGTKYVLKIMNSEESKILCIYVYIYALQDCECMHFAMFNFEST